MTLKVKTRKSGMTVNESNIVHQTQILRKESSV